MPSKKLLYKKDSQGIADSGQLKIDIPICTSSKLFFLQPAASFSTNRLNVRIDTGSTFVLLTNIRDLNNAGLDCSANLDPIFSSERLETKDRKLTRLDPVLDALYEPEKSRVISVSATTYAYSQKVYCYLLCNCGDYAEKLYPINKQEGKILVLPNFNQSLLGIQSFFLSGLYLRINCECDGLICSYNLEIYGPELPMWSP